MEPLLPHEEQTRRRIHDMSFLREVVEIEDIVQQPQPPVILPLIKRPKIIKKERN